MSSASGYENPGVPSPSTRACTCEKDEVIELAALPFPCTLDGRVVEVLHDEAPVRRQDPGRPLPAQIVHLTSLTDDDLRGDPSMRTPALGALRYAFFENHLKAHEGLRPATIRSYRDAVRLFLTFVAEDRRCRLTRVKLGDLTARRVTDFLNALETERHNHTRSRNQPLTALKGLFDYIAAQRPELWKEAERVMAIPTKRVAPPRTDQRLAQDSAPSTNSSAVRPTWPPQRRTGTPPRRPMLAATR